MSQFEVIVYCGRVQWGWLNVRGKQLGASVSHQLATRFDSSVEAMLYALAFTRRDWFGVVVRCEQPSQPPVSAPKMIQQLALF